MVNNDLSKDFPHKPNLHDQNRLNVMRLEGFLSQLDGF